MALARKLLQLAPKARLEGFLAQPNASAVVQAAKAEELYLTILDVGLEDASELVQLSSPEQFRTYVDLGGFRRDRIEPKDVLAWLRAARGDEDESYLEKLKALDLEILEYTLRLLTVVHDLEENPDANPPGVAVETAEGKFLVELLAEGADQETLRQLLQDLMAQSPFEATRLIEAIRWELPSELEEEAFRFRSARLEDLGFPPLYEALSLFTYVDPDKLAASTSKVSQTALAPSRERVDYVEAAFRALSQDERESLEDQVRYVVNAALVAESAEPGDPHAVRRVSELARDYLSLGLEHLTAGDPSGAGEALRAQPLKRIFQLGFSLTLKLKFRVDRLAKEPLAKIAGQWLLLSEEAAAIQELAKKRPLRALKVPGAEPVPFRSRKELVEANGLLDRAVAQRAVLSAILGGSEERAREALAQCGGTQPIDRAFGAAVAWAVLDGEVAIRPVPEARLVELFERLIEGKPEGPMVRVNAQDRAFDAFARNSPAEAHAEARAMVARQLGRLCMELGRAYLKEGRVDPKVAGEFLPLA